MKIEIGDYVRTKKGKIFQYDKGRAYLGKDNAIVKHSKNIIDLIEVGDYVNGKEVYIQDGKLAIELAEHIPPYELLENIEIETILTKEQYTSNCYKVERKKKC